MIKVLWTPSDFQGIMGVHAFRREYEGTDDVCTPSTYPRDPPFGKSTDKRVPENPRFGVFQELRPDSNTESF